MPRTSKQTKTDSTVQPVTVDQLADLLGELPDKPTSQPEPPAVKLPLKDVVAQLFTPIQGALEKGYTHQEIVEIMGQHGFPTTTETLKSYLNRSQRQSAPKSANVAKKVTQTKAPKATPKTESKSTEPATPQEPVQADVEVASTPSKAVKASATAKRKASTPAKTKSRTPATTRKSAAKAAPAAKTTAHKPSTTGRKSKSN